MPQAHPPAHDALRPEAREAVAETHLRLWAVFGA